jgi:O-antigen ligase
VVAVFVLAAIFLTFAVARPPRGDRLPGILVALWAFTLAMVFLTIWSPFPQLALVRAGQLLVAAFFATLIAQYARSSQMWLLCHTYLVVVTVSIVIGVAIRFPVNDAQQAGRFRWLYLHPNTAGTYLAVSTVLLLGGLLRFRGAANTDSAWPTWWYGTGLAIHFAALLATGSRGAIAGAVAALIVVGWSATRLRRRLDLAILGVSAFAALWLAAGGDIVTFLKRGDTPQTIGTLSSRTEVWSQGWALYQQRPIFGHGFMAARGAFLENFGLGGAHNAFVEVLVNGGAFGTAAFAVFLIAALRTAGQLGSARQPDGPVIQGILVALVVNGFTEGGLAQAATVSSLWLFIAAGWAAAARRWEIASPSVSQPVRPPLRVPSPPA